jgi:hypothetical protein
MEEGVLVIYYSTVSPMDAAQRATKAVERPWHDRTWICACGSRRAFASGVRNVS